MNRRRWRISAAVVVAAAVAATLGVVASPSSAAPVDATGGSITWGVRASFRSYVTGPIAHGAITVGAPATQASGNGVFTFPVNDGSHDADTSASNAVSTGSVQFVGHQDLDGSTPIPGSQKLEVSLSDVRVQVTGSTGVIIADVVSRQFVNTTTQGPLQTYNDVQLVSLDLAGITPTTGTNTISYANVPTTLTAAGAPAFAGFYPAGDPFDPVSFTLELEDGSGPVDPPDEPDTLTWKMSQHAWTSSSLAPAHEAGAPAVKDAANGWVFPASGTGTYDDETGAVAVDFAGSFTLGNTAQGAYRIKLENPSFTIGADGAGELVADASYCTGPGGSTPCSGPWASQADVTIVAFDTDVDPATITTDNNRYTITVTPPAAVAPATDHFHAEFMTFLTPSTPSLLGHFRSTGSGSDVNKPPSPITVSFAYEEDVPEPPTGVSDSVEITTEVVQAGGLTISIEGDTVVLPSPTLNGAGTWLTTSGPLSAVTVVDTRTSDPGWTVSAQLTDFAGPGGASIGAANLGWTPSVTSSSPGQAVSAGAAVAPGEGVNGKTLGSATAGSGRGTAVFGAGLSLQAPTNTPLGNYSATLTLTAI